MVIPFWILDFRFWIVKHLLNKRLGFPSVAIIFQIGIIFYSPYSPLPFTPFPIPYYRLGVASPNLIKRAIAILTIKINIILKAEPKPQFWVAPRNWL